jgi:hypothetical protein
MYGYAAHIREALIEDQEIGAVGFDHLNSLSTQTGFLNYLTAHVPTDITPCKPRAWMIITDDHPPGAAGRGWPEVSLYTVAALYHTNSSFRRYGLRPV